MAWDLRGNMDEEIERAILLKTLTPEQLAELYPPYPDDHPVIITGENGVSRVENREWISENGELHDHSQLSTRPYPLSPHASPLTPHSSPLSNLQSPPSIPFLAFMALALAPIAG
jgi:penicillin amidase